MTMAACYIGLGANLGQPVNTIRAAIQSLVQEPLCHDVAASSLYRSAPMGPPGQPDYINAVVFCRTPASPLTFLNLLQYYEHQYGRQRAEHWGPRTLDLDLLLYDNQHIQSPRLQVPHPGLTQREFVLTPLAELAPALQLPDGQQVRELARSLPQHGLRKLD